MQISSRSIRWNQSGAALIITLSFLLVTLIVFASIMYWVTSSARVTTRNNLFNMSQAAAQAATEKAIAQMDRDFISQSLNATNVYTVLIPDTTSWPVQFQFSDTNGHANQIYVSIYPQNWSTNLVTDLGSQFKGLFGDAAVCDVIATATPINAGSDMSNMSAVVSQHVMLCAIPVFQYAVFYNMDLDFSPGSALTMNGKVHCNGTIWMYPQATATFTDAVEASVIVTNKDNPNDQQNLTSYVTPINYATLPGGNPRSGVDTLALPIMGANGSASNVEAILNLPPTAVAAPNAAAYYPSNQIYLYNTCDLIISNAFNGSNGVRGTNITIFYQDNYMGSPLTQFTNNEICTFSNKNSPWNVYSTNSPVAINITNYIRIASSFPFVTNIAFYDFREGKTVQAVQIDVAKLNTWLVNSSQEGYCWNQVCGGSDGVSGHKGHPIDSIFVYNSVPLTSSQLPAVRVVNGQQLPSAKGLTIATPMPLYTLGNYNITTDGTHLSTALGDTTYTYPAALMGDAITILSGNWDDGNSLTKSGSAYNSPDGNGNRDVSINITVNAACLEGIVPSTFTTRKQYSGGLENFLRLQEAWSGQTLTYNGSIVVMFPSIYATNYWIGPSDRSGYPTHNYTVPTRAWGFDTKFKTQSGMPPAVPQAKAIIRGTWTAGGN
jgi:hypothetical protein